MKIYNYSEARQNFASLLNTSLQEEVIIKRKDGSEFKIIPVQSENNSSPFDVEGIDTKLSTKDVISIIREFRERS